MIFRFHVGLFCWASISPETLGETPVGFAGFLEAKAGQSVEIQLNGQLPDWPSTAGAPVFFKISIPPKGGLGVYLSGN